METLLMYLLKMLICSGILFGYYRLALYNERFHQWNRFYLLAAMVLSVVVPFLSIPVFTKEDPGNVEVFISAMPWNIPVSVAVKQPGLLWQDMLLLLLGGVSIILFLRIIVNITKLFITYKANEVISLNSKVKLILTQLNYAPFSFFNWLFWRQEIDPASDNGQRMLTHELTHIKEHHSADKLFTEVLLCVFWMNPFFWLMRRELATIHEFLADRRAINQQDGAAFAAMILHALHVQPASTSGLVNPFFSSQIKRRLLMITASKEPKYSYLRRLSGLMLMLCSAIVLTLSIQQAKAQQKEGIIQNKTQDNPQKQDTSTKINSVKSKLLEKHGEAITLTADSITWNKDKSAVIEISAAGHVNLLIDSTKLSSGTVKNAPLYIYDGQEIAEKEMGKINPNSISKINVLKGESAIEKYGDKGKYGVVIITGKKGNDEQPVTKSTPKEVIVNGYATKTTTQQNTPDRLQDVVVVGRKIKNVTTQQKTPGELQDVVVVGRKIKKLSPVLSIDGKEATEAEMNNLKPDNISSINVLKGTEAVTKYGDEGKDGAIEITTKQTANYDKIFTKVEQPATFPGGEPAWKRYFEKNFRYPDAATKAGTEGNVRIQFLIDEQGNVSKVKVISEPGNGIGAEAIRLLEKRSKVAACQAKRKRSSVSNGDEYTS